MNEEAKCDPTAKVSARVATDQVVDKYLKEIMPEINRAIDEKTVQRGIWLCGCACRVFDVQYPV